MPEWFLIGVLIVSAVFVVTYVWASRNDWFAGRSREFTSLAPQLSQLMDLGRHAGDGGNQKTLFAEHFEVLADCWLSGSLAHPSARQLLERTMRVTLNDMAKSGIDVTKLFEDAKYERSQVFMRTIPS
ncbi:hypothetical protein [Rhizobium sp. BK176]|uniref:hypothetical protein n=1 Tax=Rhizobium sp. BK176 TaxID=2587071 RepID=UPI0021691771|nr:hypothetical protein [Rhizobium sp. BK176]MCS4090155.1 hypothetical protein [Rhizobium sp. BK176]